MMVLVSHPIVNSYTRNISLALAEGGMLDEFVTTLGWGDGGWLMRCAPKELKVEWSRRQVHPLVARKVRRHGWLEGRRLLAARLGFKGLGCHESDALAVDAVYQELDRFVAKRLHVRPRASAVYCGEDGALETFRVARACGLKCLYDLPIGYWEVARRVFDEEMELMPAFAPTLQGRKESTEKLERKREEAELADRIVVCSNFVASTLRESGFTNRKISVVPYGGPPPIRNEQQGREINARAPLKLLFVGSIGQRKGIGYLLMAMQQLKAMPVELTLMGTFVGDRALFRPYEHLFHHESPRAHSQVLELMQKHDVLVLPSLWEGFALVILEAMASGLPVIVTPNTGAAEIVRHGVDGFLIPIRSSQAITEAIDWMVRHRGEVQQMGRNAAQRAAEFGWERFRAGILQSVRLAREPSERDSAETEMPCTSDDVHDPARTKFVPNDHTIDARE